MLKFFLLLLSMCSCVFISAEPSKKGYALKKNVAQKEMHAVVIVRYYVDQSKPEDTPFYDEEDEQCFCAPRDKFLYKRNRCDIKERSKR